MIRNPLKTAPKGLQESRGRKMLPERSEHGCFSKDSENQLSTYQKVCENNSSPLNYNYLNNKIIYRKPGIAGNIFHFPFRIDCGNNSCFHHHTSFFSVDCMISSTMYLLGHSDTANSAGQSHLNFCKIN